MFPKVPDQHKPNHPLVPNGLGVLYVLISTVYLFIVYFLESPRPSNGVSAPLTLAVCVLFGGFMGMLDDWMDLKWRHKAFLPLIAAIPLVAFASIYNLRTTISIPVIGTLNFYGWYYFAIIPIIVTVVTNTVNQLGGLNGLETVCPAIVMIGLMSISGSYSTLLFVPLIVWLVLAAFNLQGKIFVGNTGSFAIGLTLAAYAIISDLKSDLLISISPYILNSVLILLTYFFFRAKAQDTFDGHKLCSDHRRSLRTLITYHRPLTERQVVTVISLATAASTAVAVIFQLIAV